MPQKKAGLVTRAVSYLGKVLGAGYEILSGVTNGTWTKANEIWKQFTTADLEHIHNTQVVVYACVKKICLSAAEAPIAVGREVVKNGVAVWEDIDDHPLTNIFRQPNPQMGEAEFKWHLMMHWLIAGESYIWKWRNGLQEAGELWPIPSSWVKPVYGDKGVVAYEIFQGGNKPWLPVRPRDITRVTFPDPTNLTRGLGPLQAALREVQTDEERQDYFVEMLSNARTPGLVFKQPEDWTEDQINDIRASVSSGLGRGRRGRPLFLQGEGAAVEQMAPLKDLDWPGLTTLSETRICAAFGVPPILIGLRSGLDASTYSNYEQAKKSFYQDTMVPLWTVLDSALTKSLVRDEELEDDDLEVYHDTSNIRALRDDEDKLATRAGQLLTAGVIMKDEARQMIGLNELPEGKGKVFIMPMSMVEVPLDGGAAETPPPDDGSGGDAE